MTVKFDDLIENRNIRVNFAMTDEIKPEVIKKTQTTLGRYIKKPPLTEKLLRKPPFRFLHDVISAVIKETGFLENLFSEEELNPDIRDKEAKVAYLTKLINAVKLVTGTELTVRPSKIIAGQEVTKTNELLQAIAKALDKNINSAEAVEHYKANLEKESRKVSHSKSSKHEPLKTASTKARHAQAKQSTEESEKIVETVKTASQHGRSSRKQVADQDDVKKKDTGSVSKTQQMKKPKINDAGIRQPKASATPLTKNKNRKSTSIVNPEFSEVTQNDHVQSTPTEASEPPLSVVEPVIPVIIENMSTDDPVPDVFPEVTKNIEAPETSQEKHDNLENTPIPAEPEPRAASEIPQPKAVASSVPDPPVARPKDFLRPPSSRPSSARPAAPKLRWKPDFASSSNDLGLLKNEAVIVEMFDGPDDDNDSMVVLETETNEFPVANDALENFDADGTQEHGYLVAQILETQRELAKASPVDLISNKIDIETERNYKKYAENVTKEVEKLRGTIQTLTRATHPMGKLLDFLQEDVELMQKELADWRHQFTQLYNQLQIEKATSQATTESLEGPFNEIQAGIDDQLTKIYQTKQNIMKNNHKIQQLLEGRA